MTVKSRWLALIQKRLNPRTMQAARDGKNWFWIMHHVGRSTGKRYETPIILAPVPEGFICELTYGDQVNWYQNLVAAGGAEVERAGLITKVGAPEAIDENVALAAFGSRATILRILRRHEFRLLPRISERRAVE